MFAFLALVLLAQAASPTPSPSSSPSPEPSPSATPVVTVAPDFSAYGFYTNGESGLDTQVSNALVTVTANLDKLRISATAGQYGFPGVGFPIVPNNQPGANTELYTALPLAALTYSFDSHFSLAAGKFATLLGQESNFTYQNLNVQRGIGWVMEPTISRGVQAAYVSGPWSLTLQENDAYYAGSSGRAIEGLAGWSPTSATSLLFAFVVPGVNAPPNPTTSVGNKAEYDLMFTRQIGKLQLLPYVLFVNSPHSAPLGYARPESATAAVLLAAWSFSPLLSLPLRYEYASNASSSTDTGLNADLVGFGPGSHAQTLTLTPTLRFANSVVLRLEFSNATGTAPVQNRIGFEFGVMH